MKFQLLLKGCTIEAALDEVILRDWRFQLLLKGCTIEALPWTMSMVSVSISFSCC